MSRKCDQSLGRFAGLPQCFLGARDWRGLGVFPKAFLGQQGAKGFRGSVVACLGGFGCMGLGVWGL